MRYDPALAEAYPLPDREPQGPGLDLVQGLGEDGGIDGHGRPDLYLAPDRPSDPADALVAGPAAETEQETSVEPLTETGKGDVMRPLIRRRRAAHEAGRRIVRRASPRKRGEHAHSDVVEIYWGERRRKGGGGSWLIREHMRKLEAEAKARAEAEAESHESNCDCPLHDALAA